MTLTEYEEIRSHPQRFFTALGHQDIAVRTHTGIKVGQTAQCVIVDKVGVAAEIAKARYRDLPNEPADEPNLS